MTFTIIGLEGDAAVEYLESGADLCFGKHFAKSADACINCRAPAISGGKLVLMKDLCAAALEGRQKVDGIVRLSSRDVMERVERGVPLVAIFREILGQCSPALRAAEARQLLVDRAFHLKSIGFDLGPIPRTKDLVESKP